METLEAYRERIMSDFQARDRELYTYDPSMFVPSFREALDIGTETALRDILRSEIPDVWVFDMLEPDYCRRLIDEVEWFGDWCIEQGITRRAPNTMNNYGAVLDDFGFTLFLRRLMIDAVLPFSSLLYPDVGRNLDGHHGFVVDYEIGKDEDLGFHVDESDVTLNVCLGQEFEHGELYFAGVRCAVHQQTMPRPEEEFLLSHQPGIGLLHRGKHRHAARKITSGRRMNLILWCMNSVIRTQNREECKPWCQWREE